MWHGVDADSVEWWLKEGNELLKIKAENFDKSLG